MLDEMVRSRQVQDRSGILVVWTWRTAVRARCRGTASTATRPALLSLGSSVKMSIEMFLFVLYTFIYMTSCDVIGVLGAV